MYYRIAWVRRDLKNHLVPSLLQQAGTHSIKPGISELHPTWLWTPSAMGHLQLLQPIPVPHHPRIYPSVLPEFTPFQIKRFLPCPVPTCSWRKSLSIFLIGSLQVLKAAIRSSPKPALLQATPILSAVFHRSGTSHQPGSFAAEVDTYSCWANVHHTSRAGFSISEETPRCVYRCWEVANS